MNAERASEPGQTRTTSLVIFGASGDLTSRLLLPALGQLLTDQPHRRVQLLGAGVETWTEEHWQSAVRSAFAGREASGTAVDSLLNATTYFAAAVSDPREQSYPAGSFGPVSWGDIGSDVLK